MRTCVLASPLALLLFTACRGSSPGAQPTAAPSAERSSVAVSAGSVAADGVTPATVTVTVRDGEGQPIAGVPVTISYGGDAEANAPSAVSDAAGTAVFQLTAGAPTDGAVAVTLGGDEPVVVEASTPLAFHACASGAFVNGACLPPPWLSLLPATPASFAGSYASEVAAADLDGNGCDDVVVPHDSGGTVQVYLGLCDGRFAPRITYPQGRGVWGGVVADLTGDAIPDIATYVDTGTQASGLRVLAGRGDGSFAPAPATFPLAASYPFAAADVDGDGDQDLLARPGLHLAVLVNDGQGAFSAGARLAEGISSIMPSGAAGDLDRDGDVDLVLAFRDKADIYVLLGAGDGTFGAPTPFPNAAKPYSLALGDVDRDGDLDVVTSHGNAASTLERGRVDVLLGNGDGSFAGPASFESGGEPTRVAAGDGDGDADVLVLNRSDASVGVFRSNGGGSLAAPIAYAAGESPWGFAVASLDRDARADLVVASLLSGTLTGIMGLEGGRLDAPAHVRLAPLPRVATGDVNGDGMVDLVGGDPWTNAVKVALGAGGRTFLPPAAYAVGAGPEQLVVGDLDGDARDDVLALNKGSDEVSLLLGRADGNLHAAGTWAVGDYPMSAAIGDLDGDGARDVAVANGAGTSTVMSLLWGNGDGTFAVGTTAAPGFTRGVALADLDGDGDLDVVLAQLLPPALHVLENADGAFGAPVGYPVGGAGSLVPALALADLDGDGDVDAVAADEVQDRVEIFLGDGDLTFAPATAYGVGENPQAVAVGDVDGDGTLDVVTADASSCTASILAGRGDGTFAEAVSIAAGQGPASVQIIDVEGDGFGDIVLGQGPSVRILPGGPGGPAGWTPVLGGRAPASVAAADFDGDGAADLAIANGDPSGRIGVALGNGDGTFRRRTLLAAEYYARDAGAADLNADGRMDLVTSHAPYGSAGTIGVLLGRGDGTFAPQATYAAGVNPSRFEVGDVNGDGRLDVVVSHSAPSLGLLLGDGAGGFGAMTEIPGTGANHLALADLNGDGKLDLALTRTQGTGGSLVLVFLGNGDGTFLEKARTLVYYPTRLVAADLDGDGDLDLAVATENDPLAILRGNGDGTFAPPVHVSALAGPVELVAADLDQDGDLDLAMAGTEPVVVVLRNAGDGTVEPFGWSTVGSGRQSADLAAADLDGDGRPDLALLTTSGAHPLLARAP